MKCQKFNHFSSVCKSKGQHNSKKGNERKLNHKPPENSRQKCRINRTTEEDADNSTSTDDEFFCQAVRQLKQVKEIKTDGEDRTISVKREDIHLFIYLFSLSGFSGRDAATALANYCCPLKARPQHRELRALLFMNSVWVL